ncbi:MAG: response regulator [Lachnospiraceae bacterium]|nr:response regulator [Lachnospiraceae bacterium]
MLRIAVCDDDEQQCAEICVLAEQYIIENGITAKVWGFSSAFALLSDVEEKGAFDLYLMDVLMPQMDGIKLGVLLRKTDTAGLIIYLSTAREFALESYEARAFHYLVKPVDRVALFRVLDMAIPELEKSCAIVVHIKTRGEQCSFAGMIFITPNFQTV